MNEQDDRVEALSLRSLLRSLWWLPWLCFVQITYGIPRMFVNWVGQCTTGRGMKYS